MRIVKLTNTAGRDLYINIDSVSYIAEDPFNGKNTQLHLGKDFHVVSMSINELLTILDPTLKKSK